MEGTPPRDTSRGPSSPSSAAVAGHSFIHSPAISTPSRDCPPPKGWRFPSGPRKSQPLSSKRVCNCSGARLPGRQRGAVPGRLGRTHPSGPSPSGRLGPGLSASRYVPQPPSEEGKFLQLGKGQGGRAGRRWCFRWHQKLWPLPHEVLGPCRQDYLEKTEPVDEAVSSCPCPSPKPHSLSSEGWPSSTGAG